MNDLMLADGEESATWDGKDYSVIQLLTFPFHDHEPITRMDRDWNLSLRLGDDELLPMEPGDILVTIPHPGGLRLGLVRGDTWLVIIATKTRDRTYDPG